MGKRLKIYIAGPYTAPTELKRRDNVHKIIDLALKLFQSGHYPYIPHLTHYIDQRAQKTGIKLDWDDYMTWSMPWIDLCDALFYTGRSKGADLELDYAKKLGLKIYYSIKDIPKIKSR